MIKATISAIALAALLSPVVTAQAATLANRDGTAHKIVVVEGDVRREVTIGASQQINELCKTSCLVYVGTDPEPYLLTAQDRAEIHSGDLFPQEEPAAERKGQ